MSDVPVGKSERGKRFEAAQSAIGGALTLAGAVQAGQSAAGADGGLSAGAAAIGAATQALSGYAAGQALAGTSLIAGNSALARALPGIGAALAVAAFIHGARDASREARKNARFAAGRLVETELGAPEALPWLYGYNRVNPVRVFFAAGRRIGTRAADFDDALGRLWQELGDAVDGTGFANAVALAQFDLAAGGIARIVELRYRGESIRGTGDGLFNKRAAALLVQPGVASGLATNFDATNLPAAAERTARTTFLRKAHLDIAMWQRSGDPGHGFFQDVVEMDELCVLFGDGCRIPAKTGNAYSLGAKAETRNPFAVVADFLLDPEKGARAVAPNLSATQFTAAAGKLLHLKSLYEAWEIAERCVTTCKDADGNDEDPSERVRMARCAALAALDIANGHSTTVADATYAACMEQLGNKELTANRIESGIDPNSAIGREPSQHYARRVYQFDGPLPSNVAPALAVGLALEVAPGALMARDNAGLVRFDIPDWTRPLAPRQDGGRDGLAGRDRRRAPAGQGGADPAEAEGQREQRGGGPPVHQSRPGGEQADGADAGERARDAASGAGRRDGDGGSGVGGRNRRRVRALGGAERADAAAAVHGGDAHHAVAVQVPRGVHRAGALARERRGHDRPHRGEAGDRPDDPVALPAILAGGLRALPDERSGDSAAGSRGALHPRADRRPPPTSRKRTATWRWLPGPATSATSKAGKWPGSKGRRAASAKPRPRMPAAWRRARASPSTATRGPTSSASSSTRPARSPCSPTRWATTRSWATSTSARRGNWQATPRCRRRGAAI